MKSKILYQIGLLMLMSICISTSAFARLERCTAENGGLLFEGENGQSYCLSRRTMNWWSAFSWCKGVGGELATIDEACPSTGYAVCTNIKGKQTVITSGYAWLTVPASTTSSYLVSLSSSSGAITTATRATAYYALCY